MHDFVHLHVHSQYSILDGQASIQRLVDKAIANGMRGMALTDHGNMFGVKEFYNYVNKKNGKVKDEIKDLKKRIAALESGKEEADDPQAEIASCKTRLAETERKLFKPIIGCEMYVAHRRLFNKDGKPNDDTFERTKDLINCSIIYVSYDDSRDYLEKLLEYKRTYNIIKDKHLEHDLPPKHFDELSENLSVSNLDNEYLHTIILLEDATQFMRSKSAGYVNDLMTKCRHIQCSFFVIIHYWKALSTNLKSNLSTIYIFSGYSRQQLNYILYQININDSLKDIYDKYKRLTEHGKLIIDSNLCNCCVEV